MNRLAVSNIAWRAADDLLVLALLGAHGVAGVELAPTRLWPDWQGATVSAAGAYRRLLEDHGLVVPALQSLLFGQKPVSIFETGAPRAGLLEHLARVAELAAALGARVLVFGSPGARRLDGRPRGEALPLAADFFSDAAACVSAYGVSLGLETVPPCYGDAIGKDWQETLRLIEAVDHPGLVAHFDIACVALAGDDVAASIAGDARRVAHCHLSEPSLAPLGHAGTDHAALGAGFRAAGYRGWLSIEMRETAIEDIAAAIQLVQRRYLWSTVADASWEFAGSKSPVSSRYSPKIGSLVS